MEIGAQDGLAFKSQGKSRVRNDAALVKFVKKYAGHAGKALFVRDHAGKDTLGHHQESG